MRKKLYEIAIEIWDNIEVDSLDENTLNHLVDEQLLVEENYSFNGTYIPNKDLSITSLFLLVESLTFPDHLTILLSEENEIDYFIHSSYNDAFIFRRKNLYKYKAFTKIIYN